MQSIRLVEDADGATTLFCFFFFTAQPPSLTRPLHRAGRDKTEEGGGKGGDKNPSEGVYLLSTPPKRSIFLIWVQVIIFHITAPGSRVKWLIF